MPKEAIISRRMLFAFASPAIPISAMGLPLVVHLPPFYAGTMGLGLTMVGSIFMLARFWDVVTDPILGIMSDRFETRWGRRRHWIVLSVPVMLLSVYKIFMPDVPVSEDSSIVWFVDLFTRDVPAGAVYLIFWLFVLYVGWTLLTISHVSWGAELTPDYHERSRVQGTRELLLIVGMVLVLALPALIENMHPADVAAARVASMGWFVIALLPITVALAVWSVPEHPAPRPEHVPFRQAIGVLFENRPLRLVLFADLISGVSGGIVAGLFLFIAEDALKLERFSSVLLLCYFISGIAFIPAVLWFSRRVGKHKAAAWSALFNAATLPVILLVPAGNVPFAFAAFVLFGVNMAAGPFLFRSIMADVADHDAVQTKQTRTGLFYSLLTSTNKIGAAVAIGVSYWMLDLVGFVPGGANSPAALEGLRIVYVLPTSIIAVGVAIILWRFPLDEAQQRVNREILDGRLLDAAAAAVETRTLMPSDSQSAGAPAD